MHCNKQAENGGRARSGGAGSHTADYGSQCTFGLLIQCAVGGANSAARWFTGRGQGSQSNISCSCTLTAKLERGTVCFPDSGTLPQKNGFASGTARTAPGRIRGRYLVRFPAAGDGFTLKQG